jgi:Secretion system C-terminal sorting domain/SprB repeat
MKPYFLSTVTMTKKFLEYSLNLKYLNTMKKLYFSLSLGCFAVMGAMAQSTTPPPAGSRVTVKGTSSSTACDGTAHFDAGTIKTWKWFKDTVVIQTNGVDLGKLCDGNYSVQFPDSAGANYITNKFAIGVVNTAGTGTVTPTGSGGTPPPAGSRVTIKGTTSATSCDGAAHFDAGSLKSWKWFHDTALVQTNGADLSQLCNGNYSVQFPDSSGANMITNKFAIGVANNPPPTGTGTGTVTPNPGSRVTFSGATSQTACDGKAHFNAGATKTWKWFKDSALVQTDGLDIAKLCVGNYSVQFLDSIGTKELVERFFIGVPNGTPTNTMTPTGNGGNGSGFGTCPGFEAHAITTNSKTAASCDGTAEIVIVKGGRAPFTFKWTGSTITTKTRTGLCPGKYEMTVVDSAGCKYTDTAYVKAGKDCSTFKAHIISKGESTAGACDGSAEAFADGGVAPFTYHWSGSNINTKVQPNLCAGMYFVKIIDANGCGSYDSTRLDKAIANIKPCQFFAVRTLVVNDTLHTTANACGGYIEAVCKGFRAPLSFMWADNASNTTPFHKGTCEGKYTVTVTDSVGCKATITTYVGVNKPQMMMPPPAPGVKPLRLFVKSMDVTNAALCNGKAKAMVEGGKAPYKFTLGASSAVGQYYVADSLCAGFYTISVMDADSASRSFVFVIGSPASTFVPPVVPFVNPVIKDTLVASAISTCTIDYDAIDSIRITNKNFVGTDTIKAIWTVYQKGGASHTVSQHYNVNSATGICKFVLDLFCTNRTSGNVKAEDYISLDLLSTGISALESAITNVYPNPFDNQITVVCDKNAGVFIVDITGRTVYSGVLNAGTSTISTDNLNAGMYFVNIKNGQKMTTKKLIKH